MARLLVINCTILAVAFLLGIFSGMPSALAENGVVANRHWQLDAQKAKVIAMAAKDEESPPVNNRQKRWWRRRRRRERNRENNYRQCQASCWSAWSGAGACSVSCGNGGTRTRYRSVVRNDCVCPGSSQKVESCTRPCHNGGTPRRNDCSCPPAFTGTCCQSRLVCGNPGTPAYGSVNPAGNTHYYNDKVTYSCNPGWQVSGGTNPRTCQSTGRWSGSLPSCIRKPCSHPGTPQDGSVAPTLGFVFETLAQFSCNPGFSLSGSETSVCHSNQQWSHNLPSCNRISCGNPGQIPDGTVTGTNYKFGDKIQYSCTTGFTLIGSSERECLADGSWSCDTPRCTSSVSLIPKCPALPLIEHGTFTLSDDNYYRSIAEFSCDDGYFLNGDHRIACQVDQQWSDPNPTCARITCPRLTAPLNGQVTQPDGSPEYGSRATFSCNSGYRLDGDATASCGGRDASGTWSAAVPVCHAVDCGTPTRPEHGRIVGSDFTFMHTVDVQCGPGYFLEGSVQLTCSENGEWVGEGDIPSCNECPLNYYKDGENAATSCTRCPDNSHTATSTSTSVLQCVCNSGYLGSNGGPCTIVSCPDLVTPENGNIAPCGKTYQSVCNQSCDPGHVLHAGTPSRKCLYTGFWSGEPIKCKACPKDTYQESTYFCRRCPDNSVTLNNASLLTDCICATGFQSEEPGQNCTDTDECAGDHPCEHTCINSPGSFRCKCPSGYTLAGLPDENPTNCKIKPDTCPDDDLIPPINGGLTCGIVEVFEQYCVPYCNPGHEILGHSDEYILCSVATSWKWSHTITGKDLPICTAILFATPVFEGTVAYFDADCGQLTEDQLGQAEDDFMQRLEDNGVCHKYPGGNCEIKGIDVKCGEAYEAPPSDLDFPFPFSRKKRQALPQFDTLLVNYTLALNVGSTQCTEVDCQKKYDKLVEVEQQRIRDELRLAAQPYLDSPGCPLCFTNNAGSVLQPRISGGVRVPCSDGTQRKGYTCRECQSGMYHDRQTGNCTLCPPGKYQPEAGQTECLDCPYLTSLGKSGATKCPVPPGETYDCGTNNPCLATTDPDFQQYYSHTNAEKYIQCSGYGGQCYAMPCPTGSIWKPGDNYCIPASSIRMTDIY